MLGRLHCRGPFSLHRALLLPVSQVSLFIHHCLTEPFSRHLSSGAFTHLSVWQKPVSLHRDSYRTLKLVVCLLVCPIGVNEGRILFLVGIPKYRHIIDSICGLKGLSGSGFCCSALLVRKCISYVSGKFASVTVAHSC